MKYEFITTPSLGKPLAQATIRQFAKDFRVHETLSFQPEGLGDHVYLYIEKTNCNTEWVARQLAKIAGLKQVDVGYAGLKDRHAITRQWFSLHMPGKREADWSELPENIVILEETRHQKKLRAGAIKRNDFVITLRELQGDNQEVEQRLISLKQQGFPNYFGSQRFGHSYGNVTKLVEMVEKRKRTKPHLRGIYISAGRAYLFNQILNQRVLNNNWDKAIDGDVMNLAGTRSVFVPEQYDTEIKQRLVEMDIHPAAVLWGRGERQNNAEAKMIEQQCLDKFPEVSQSLEKAGADLAYRAMRAQAENLSWNVENDNLILQFSLASGVYATSLMSEIINITDETDSAQNQ